MADIKPVQCVEYWKSLIGRILNMEKFLHPDLDFDLENSAEKKVER